MNTLKAEPALLVTAAIAHCAALSAHNKPASDSVLPLKAYQLEPSFLWAPRDARKSLFTWARDALVVEFAASVEPFSELPDDCAGDVLDYLETTMTRKESPDFAMRCLSPESSAWRRAIIAAGITVSKHSKFSSVNLHMSNLAQITPPYINCLVSISSHFYLQGCVNGRTWMCSQEW